KRLAHTPVPEDKNDDAYLQAVRKRVLQDERINTVKEIFLKEVLTTIGFKKNSKINDADLLRFADSVLVNKTLSSYPITNKVIFSFAKFNITGSDWLKYVNDYKRGKEETSKTLLNKYISLKALEYYRLHLEEYNKDFKYQLKEFEEGNMLFEIMETNVWKKAVKDSTGLLDYYNQHKEKYVWNKSADVLIFNAANTSAAELAIAALKKNASWKKIADESNGTLQVDSGRYEITQIPSVSIHTPLIEGLITTPVISGDNTAGFIKVMNIYPENQQRSFADAKGLVINDYQNYIEEKWVAQLKNKYPVKVNETVFKSLLQ
ncbi:MAG: peptidyl-prolyl cis-trans isomerase, partial [Sphingobacteriales bacterium]|nr:peptidyl-prolyl cis-trans isomerase [Sphingobacteriales bacterium]